MAPHAHATTSIICTRARAVLTELEAGEKLLFREQILEASKLIVGRSVSVPGNEDSH